MNSRNDRGQSKLMFVIAVCAALAFQPIQAHDLAKRVSWGKVILLLGLFCFTLMTMFVQAFNPFLYFQF